MVYSWVFVCGLTSGSKTLFSPRMVILEDLMFYSLAVKYFSCYNNLKDFVFFKPLFDFVF
jgi:hypothetical protein